MISQARRVPRPGFSLVELLIIIGILVVLMALAVGTFFRVQSGQVVRNTESVLSQLNTGLYGQFSAVRDQADEEFRKGNLPGTSNNLDNLVQFCGNDRDRAKAVWMYLRLRNEFPQNFLEAKNPTVLRDASNNTIISLPARRTFTTNATINGVTALPSTQKEAADEAAALLYIIVTEKGTRGQEFADLATGSNTTEVTVHGGTFTTFKDGWGSPIYYVRYATNGEIDALNSATNKDPLDPRGRLRASGWSAANLSASWIYHGSSSNAHAFPNHNWMMTTISPGAGKDEDATDISVDLHVIPSDGLFLVSDLTNDILGYRVRREGNSGN